MTNQIAIKRTAATCAMSALAVEMLAALAVAVGILASIGTTSQLTTIGGAGLIAGGVAMAIGASGLVYEVYTEVVGDDD